MFALPEGIEESYSTMKREADGNFDGKFSK